MQDGGVSFRRFVLGFVLGLCYVVKSYSDLLVFSRLVNLQLYLSTVDRYSAINSRVL